MCDHKSQTSNLKPQISNLKPSLLPVKYTAVGCDAGGTDTDASLFAVVPEGSGKVAVVIGDGIGVPVQRTTVVSTV